jgi:hypothetical protein
LIVCVCVLPLYQRIGAACGAVCAPTTAADTAIANTTNPGMTNRSRMIAS